MSSLDSPISVDNESDELYSLLPDDSCLSLENEVLRQDLRETVGRALQSLSDLEREIVEMYFGLNGRSACSYGEIGSQLDIHRDQVRRIAIRAFGKLRQRPDVGSMRDYMFV